MQKYPVRTSHRAKLTPKDLHAAAQAAFGTAQVEDALVVAKFGAIVRLTAVADGKELRIEVSMDPKVSPEVAADTVRRYNQFLEASTGFSSKERAKRLRKSATAGA